MIKGIIFDMDGVLPDPEIFKKAARKLGLKPEQCIVIEDAPGGVKAAKAAGAKCLATSV